MADDQGQQELQERADVIAAQGFIGQEVDETPNEAYTVAGVTEAPEPPNQSDNKAAWIDHAISQGLSRDEAEDLTKAELIEEFG